MIRIYETAILFLKKVVLINDRIHLLHGSIIVNN